MNRLRLRKKQREEKRKPRDKAQEAAGWLHSEEEGKRKAAQEAAEKA